MTAQSRGMSFVESWANVAIGFSINFVGNLYIWPIFGIHVRADKAFGAGLIFTVISIVRSYLIRRVFNNHELMQRIKARLVFWRKAQ